MHVPAKESMSKVQAIHQFIHENGFALLVSPCLNATHLPLYLNPEEGKSGTLYGHIAKANSHSNFTDEEQVLAVFTGPHSYISPTWYSTPVAVPTWNYTAVHCQGVIEKLDETATLTQVRQLIAQYEPDLLEDHQRLPIAYQKRLLTGIIGFKIRITHIDAREKLGQHKNSQDQSGVVEGLQRSKHANAAALKNYMYRRNIGTGEAE